MFNYYVIIISLCNYNVNTLIYKKIRLILALFLYARDRGVEPLLPVLETGVLPLYESRNLCFKLTDKPFYD